MASCNCASYEDLELRRDAISRRIKETKRLLKVLAPLATDATGEHRLLRCSECAQHWQVSRAWSWGNDPYVFRVPTIAIEDWIQQQFVEPDELLIYAAAVHDLPSPERSTDPCREVGCQEAAIRFSVFCQAHHVRQLQSFGRFPKEPYGRWFSPYATSSGFP
jgi:hypothetical protein